MIIHDWSRLDAGAFHSFHLSLVRRLSGPRNQGGLPKGYYSHVEQVSLVPIPILARKVVGEPERLTETPNRPDGALELEDGAFPDAREIFLGQYQKKRRSVSIRHESNDHLVAMIEVPPPGWKASPATVGMFAARVAEAVHNGINVVVIDLTRPGPHDPEGPHAAIQTFIAGEPYSLPSPGLLTLASYDACACPVAYVFHPAIGGLPEMPLFLAESSYIRLPVEKAYAEAWEGVPRHMQRELETNPDHVA